MLLKLLIKIWPALIPITFYLLWVFVIDKIIIKKILKKSKITNYKVVGDGTTAEAHESKFSLQNRNFVIVIYLSLIMAILSLVYVALISINH